MPNEKIFIHGDNSIKSLSKNYLICLVILVLFGFYKNGIIVFQHNHTNLYGLLKPLLVPLIGFVIGYTVSKLVNTLKYKKNGSVLTNYFFPIQTLMISMLMPIKVNILLFTVILSVLAFIYLFFFYKAKINFNFIILTTVIIILISFLISNNTNINSLFINPYEEAVLLNHSLYRLIFGYSIAGISVSNSLLIILSYFFLSRLISFKKEIPFYLAIMFGLVLIFQIVFNSSISDYIREILNSSFIFIIVFVASDNYYSPYTKLAMFFYSLLIFLLTLIMSIINFDLAIYFSILIVSFLNPVLNRVFKKTKFKLKN